VQPAEVPPREKTEEPQDEKTLFEKSLRDDPPAFSPQTLKLVVNILDANEVSSKTFSNTLTLMQYLSCLPNSIEVITEELTARAQKHGNAVLPDLHALAQSLTVATQQADVPAAVLSKFSSASSLQAKMLRVLKTIDFIQSTRSPGVKLSDEDKARHEETAKNIFLAFNFDGLWTALSACVSSIEAHPGLSHVGTVLLPMIEALMVVSKYVAKPSAAADVPAVVLSPRTPGITSTANPLERSEHHFFTFTRRHRKILNTMVRSNPTLMSGSFSILVHNPAVLEFENKRNYFSQSLHKRKPNRQHYGALQVNVRRQYVFEDSFQSLGPARRTPDQLKYGKLSVRCAFLPN
jgi:E3 ubiquitin-protein ligase HUWE1